MGSSQSLNMPCGLQTGPNQFCSIHLRCFVWQFKYHQTITSSCLVRTGTVIHLMLLSYIFDSTIWHDSQDDITSTSQSSNSSTDGSYRELPRWYFLIQTLWNSCNTSFRNICLRYEKETRRLNKHRPAKVMERECQQLFPLKQKEKAGLVEPGCFGNQLI